MTWSDLIQQAPHFAPNAPVRLQVMVQGHLVPLAYELAKVSGDGQSVVLEGMAEDMRESNP